MTLLEEAFFDMPIAWQKSPKGLTICHAVALETSFSPENKLKSLGDAAHPELALECDSKEVLQTLTKREAIGTISCAEDDDTIDGASVTIHVYDEERGVSRDVACSRNALLSSMGYFRKFIKSDALSEEVDISVHCDINIFDWLMRYIQKSEIGPRLEARSVVSLLVAADFLEMDGLVDECLQFIQNNLQTVLYLCPDFGTIKEDLIDKLVLHIQPTAIDSLDDPEDRISSLLCRKLIDRMHKRGQMSCCALCGVIFRTSEILRLDCRTVTPSVDARGRISRRHICLQSWSLYEMALESLRDGQTWKMIYWQFWLSSIEFSCARCSITFTGVEMATCSYHPKPALRGSRESMVAADVHSCCGQPVHAWALGSTQQGGCQFRSHMIEDSSPQVKCSFELLLKYCDAIILATDAQIKNLHACKLRAQPKARATRNRPGTALRYERDSIGITWHEERQLEEDFGRMMALCAQLERKKTA